MPRPGHGAVLATQETLDVMRLRYGDNFAGRTQAIAYGEEVRLGDVRIKFHPAGHVMGSAQIAVSCKDTCIVASGDYKDAFDPTCAPFEGVVAVRRVHHRGNLWAAGVPSRPCGGRGEKAAGVGGTVSRARASGRRLLAGQGAARHRPVREAGYDAPIYLHGAMEKITHYYQSRGVALGDLRAVRGMKKSDLAGTITLAPPTATSDVWTRRFPDPVTAFASGWMRVRARARQRGVELPLVISDSR